jgi:hypothetical protein
MASNTNTAAGSNAGQDIDWSTVKVLINCDKCGGQYDAIADEHESLCSVCQALFGGDEPANLTTAADTTPAVVDPLPKERQTKCGHCEKRFRPSKNNNGVYCTSCCNEQAGKGRDVFKWFGKAMSTQARNLFNEYHQSRPKPALAPMPTLPPNAPPLGAQYAPPATFTRKRAAESESEPAAPTNDIWATMAAAEVRRIAAKDSEDDQFMQQNQPPVKRARTRQQQPTTMQSTQPAQSFSLLSSDPVVLAEQDRLIAQMLNHPGYGLMQSMQPSQSTAGHSQIFPTNPQQTTQQGGDITEQDRLFAEFLDLPPYGLEQTTQPSQPTAEHSQIIPTNSQQTTQPVQDDADQEDLFEQFLNLPSDDLEEATQPNELTAGHAEAMWKNPEQSTQPGTDDSQLSNLPPNNPEDTTQPSESTGEPYMVIPKSPEQSSQPGGDDAELSNIPPNNPEESPQPSYVPAEQYEALTSNTEQTTQTYRSDEEFHRIFSAALREMN